MNYPITEETIKRLREWMNGGKSGPTNLELFLTDRCNLRCKFCEVTYRNDNGISAEKEMSWKTIERIISESKGLGVESFFITGGEPALRANVLVKTMEKVKEFDMYGHLVTNGTLLNENQIKRIVQSQFDSIMISLDSPISSIHNYLRGAEVFDEVKRNIELIDKYKRKYSIDKPFITISSVLTKVNYESIPKFVSFVEGLDINAIRFQPLIVHREEMGELKIRGNELNKLKGVVEDTKKLMDESHIDSNIGEFLDDRLVEKSTNVNDILEEDSSTGIPCYQPWYGIKINPEGKVGPCEGDFTWKSPINIKNTSLEDVWYGGYFNGIRQRIRNDGLQDECSECCIGKIFEQRQIGGAL